MTKTKPTTSLERGVEMMSIKIKDLPPPAYAYARQLCSEMGGCMEVFLTAYCAYAEIVEKYPCKDEDYRARPDAMKFFNNHK